MTIPTWLAAVIAAAAVAQVIAWVRWTIRSDNARAVEAALQNAKIEALTKEVARLAAVLERHDPTMMRADLESHAEKIGKLEEGYRAHHGLIRGLQRRMDLAGVEEHEGSGE